MIIQSSADMVFMDLFYKVTRTVLATGGYEKIHRVIHLPRLSGACGHLFRVLVSYLMSNIMKKFDICKTPQIFDVSIIVSLIKTP